MNFNINFKTFSSLMNGAFVGEWAWWITAAVTQHIKTPLSIVALINLEKVLVVTFVTFIAECYYVAKRNPNLNVGNEFSNMLQPRSSVWWIELPRHFTVIFHFLITLKVACRLLQNSSWLFYLQNLILF